MHVIYARYIRYITDRRTAHVPGHAGFAGACRVRRGMPGHAGAYRGVPSLRYVVPCALPGMKNIDFRLQNP